MAGAGTEPAFEPIATPMSIRRSRSGMFEQDRKDARRDHEKREKVPLGGVLPFIPSGSVTMRVMTPRGVITRSGDVKVAPLSVPVSHG